MSDKTLVERALEKAYEQRYAFESDNSGSLETAGLLEQLADTITRLEADKAELAKKVAYYQATVSPAQHADETIKRFRARIAELEAQVSGAYDKGLQFTPEELDLFRQWFNSVQDCNPKYHEQADRDLCDKVIRLLKGKKP